MEKKLRVIPSVVKRADSKLQNIQYPRQLSLTKDVDVFVIYKKQG
jgi:hypothetical protein